MPSKKPTNKSKSAAATPSQTASSAKASKASSVIPFAAFTSNFAPNFGASASNPSFESVEQMMNTSKNQYEKIAQDAQNAGRHSMEAMVKCGTVLSKGAEQWMKIATQMSQESWEKSSENLKSLMACKTITELTEAQNKLAQQSFEDMMQAATRLSELSIKICTEAFEPINDQLAKSIKKASESMAA